MPQPNYIPNQNTAFALWLSNFATILAAAPATFGLLPADATEVTTVNTAFQTAFSAAQDPATRTPVTVAAQSSTRQAAEATVRPYAVNIALNPSVTNANKVTIGVSLPRESPSVIPPPGTNPEIALVSAASLTHRLSIRDVTTPTSKAKPPGVVGCELWTAIGTVPAVSPLAATLKQLTTKTPTLVEFDAADRGKTCTYFARWTTRSGPLGIAQTGPWSAPTAIIIL